MRLKRVLTVFFCVLIIGAVVWAAVYLQHLHSETVSSDVSVHFHDDTLSITWNPPFQMDTCRVFRYDGETEDYVSCGQYANGIVIEAGEAEDEVRLRLQPVRYLNIFGQRIELPGFSRELTIAALEQVELSGSVEKENKTVTVGWQAQAGSTYEVYVLDSDGSAQLYAETDDPAITLDFDNNFAIPQRDEPLRMTVRAVQRTTGLVSYGPMSESMVITRNDLLENDLSLCWEQIEERRYVLSWQECHGRQYELQQWSEEKEQWVSKCVLDWTEEMTYQTDHLPSNAQVRFRVISYDSTGERDREEFKAEPSEVTFHTGMSPLYCTIWPIVPLKIMTEPQGGEMLGEVPAGQALCVLEENGDSFQILYGDCLGYIDSRFCMINLPEYLGDLCEYDITNSISSIFCVHEYILPEITGSVVKGYENVCLGNGDYLVPYLYPCSAKLYQAILSAAADGYRLRIYDAFRPNEATRYLYDTVELLLDEPAILKKEEAEEGEESEDEDGEDGEAGEGGGEDSEDGEDGDADSGENDNGGEDSEDGEDGDADSGENSNGGEDSEDGEDGDADSGENDNGENDNGGENSRDADSGEGGNGGENSRDADSGENDNGGENSRDVNSGENGNGGENSRDAENEEGGNGGENSRDVNSGENGNGGENSRDADSEENGNGGRDAENEEDGNGGENGRDTDSGEDGNGGENSRDADSEENGGGGRDAESEEDGDEGRDAESEEDGDGDRNGEEGGDREDGEFPDEEYDTYWRIMTDDGRYSLRSFLAQGVSTHNRGIALDLVLIDADTRENLPMQTEIHDLSWYSVTGQNNDNADLLALYMKGAGYNGLVTEWWHFQDDDTRNQIGLQSYLTAGVSIEGWKKDDTGWKYRLGDGSFYQNITVTIEGRTRVFDADGYCLDFYTIQP